MSKVKVNKIAELRRDRCDLDIAHRMAASTGINRAARRKWAARVEYLKRKIRRDSL